MHGSGRQCLRIFILHACNRTSDRLPREDASVAEEFIRRLAERGHVIHVATQSLEFTQSMPSNVSLHRLRTSWIWGPAWRVAFMLAVRRLFKSLQAEAPFDLIHQIAPGFAGLSLAIYGLHDTVVLGPFVPEWPEEASAPRSAWGGATLRSWIVRLQQRLASLLLVTTPAALRRVEVARARGPLVLEVPYGVDPSAFEARTTTPAAQSVLFLASIWRRKGIFTLLDSISAVRRQLPSATLTIAGHGPDEQLVRFAVERHPDRDAIRVVGHAGPSDVPELLRSHAVYCLPSAGEPFGTSILEAMACGVPVVTTNVGGPSFLMDPRGGLLVPPDDSTALADALVEVLRSGDHLEAMGRHNRAVVERRFTWDRVLETLEDAYYTTLERHERLAAESAAMRPSADLPSMSEAALYPSYSRAHVGGASSMRSSSAAHLGPISD
jgi:L-malate glycosyltransferase